MDNRPRSLAILGGAALLALATLILLRRGHGEPARPLAVTRPAPAAEPDDGPRAEAERPSPAREAAHAEARRARDAMRAEILAALRRRDGGLPATANAPAPGDEPPPGKYEASYIQKNFREDMFPILKQCYGAALKRRPELRGRLVLKFSIVGDPQVGGVVEDASIGEESDLEDPEMETCARESLLALTFDKPPSGGGLVKVTYPVLFSPGDDEEAGAEAAAPPR
jgi:hypothetical protein